MLKLENMKEWEKILMVIRRHWFIYVMLWLYFLWAAAFSVILYFLLWVNTLTNIANVIIWIIFSLFLYLEWLNHELDLYVVTDSRVIWIEQHWFLDRTVSECNLWQIQEVNSHTKWLIANLLDFWDLKIQTAWNITTMSMQYVPIPMQNARKILNVVDEYREKYQISKNNEI